MQCHSITSPALEAGVEPMTSLTGWMTVTSLRCSQKPCFQNENLQIGVDVF